MKLLLRIAILAVCVFCAACVYIPAQRNVHREWAATGGSRADATVELSYEISANEKPLVDEDAGLRLAKERCQSWGYADAEPFGGTKRTMNGPNTWLVTKTYQCTGQGSETSHK